MTVRGRSLGWLVAGCVATASSVHAQSIGGKLVADTLHSRALEHNLYGDTPDRPMLVYLPATYATSPTKRYPVVASVSM